MRVLNGCLRCPSCFQLPSITLEDKVLNQPGVDTVLRCATHQGHVASGDDLEMAVLHWNRYIRNVTQLAGQYFLDGPSSDPRKSYCTYCQMDTDTQEFRDWKECTKCHAVKLWKKVA